VDLKENYERCLNSKPEDSVLEAVWKLFSRVNSTSVESSNLKCSDVLKEGCIAGTENRNCYCDTTSKNLTLGKAKHSNLLNIYDAASKRNF
jgi:hypothetical protein